MDQIKQALELYKEGQKDEALALIKELRSSNDYYDLILNDLSEANEAILANEVEDVIPLFLKNYRLNLEVSADQALSEIKRHLSLDSISGKYLLKEETPSFASETEVLLSAFSVPTKINLDKEDLEFLKTTGADSIDIELLSSPTSFLIEEKRSVPDQAQGFISNVVDKLQIFAMNVATNRKAMVALSIGASVAVSLMGNSQAMAHAADVPNALANLDLDNMQNHLEKLTEVDNAIQLVENKFSKGKGGGSGSFHFQVEKCSVQGTYDKSGVDMMTTGSSKCRIIADTLASIVRKKISKELP